MKKRTRQIREEEKKEEVDVENRSGPHKPPTTNRHSSLLSPLLTIALRPGSPFPDPQSHVRFLKPGYLLSPISIGQG